MLHTGAVRVSQGRAQPWPMRLHLNVDSLTLQKEVQHDTDVKIEKKVRRVQLRRSGCHSLGISVKGGRDNHLPILVSRLTENKLAALSRLLHVGDAILKIDGVSVTKATHKDAVDMLKKAGPVVTLHVKYYEVAARFLNKTNLERRSSDSSITTYFKSEDGWRTPTTPDSRSLNGFELEECLNSDAWQPVVHIPLLMAMITRYVQGTDKLRHNAFEVRAVDGTSTGVVLCDDLMAMSQWTKYISNNITGLTNLQIKLYNRDLPTSEHIVYMGWVCEGYISSGHMRHDWAERFIALKGSQLFIFDEPPREAHNWPACNSVHFMYEVMFRAVRESENIDERQHCFIIQTKDNESHYMSVETRQDLIRLETSWLHCVHQSVARLSSKTFVVKCDDHQSELTLDWNLGFALFDCDTHLCCWSYKFAQLKSSSDDGNTGLRLDFVSADGTQLHTREVECGTLQSLLFCMHAFLTAKVASVDPSFLQCRL